MKKYLSTIVWILIVLNASYLSAVMTFDYTMEQIENPQSSKAIHAIQKLKLNLKQEIINEIKQEDND